ncbi:hypothetical protein like AT3G01190 [Hibiscus trionum]|uniref:peroxidase n=1 Tax=Hibiscus trionum TaxID=183268 RepID=A0A9W7JB47_HIBTR|nr:hypothetical protein like AT3G01190 [Hibiscus trionum]
MVVGQRVFLFQLIVVAVLVLNHSNAQGLKLGYYHKTCPSAESIVRKTTYGFISRAPTLAAPLLRLHFHDCFVRGCDGSVLLNSTKNQAEKDAIPNLSLRGFHVIDAVKSAVEKACPGVVSCADILALVARDSVSMIHGPSWEVPLGRRDGKVSSLNEALANFMKDLAVLSGGHTIGTSHCVAFAGSFKTFDEDYYTLVTKRRGLFESDAALLNDAETKAYVFHQASVRGSTFAKDFAVSMVKMGRVGVLTGNQGEIRKHCAFVN